MSKQTKGPFSTNPVGGTSLTEIRNGENYSVATVRWPELADRIIACMNACEGVDDDTLVIAATCSNPGFGRIIQAAFKQRDDIRSAHEALVESCGTTCRAALETLPAILAPQLATLNDDHAIRQLLEEHINTALNELCDRLAGLVGAKA